MRSKVKIPADCVRGLCLTLVSGYYREVEMPCRKNIIVILHDLDRRELPFSLNQSDVDNPQIFVEKSGCHYKVKLGHRHFLPRSGNHTKPERKY